MVWVVDEAWKELEGENCFFGRSGLGMVMDWEYCLMILEAKEGLCATVGTVQTVCFLGGRCWSLGERYMGWVAMGDAEDGWVG